MRPFFVTASEARMLPRVLLVGLCVLYVVPGFVGRDPWLLDDAASFGVIVSMLRDNLSGWLTPHIFGQPFYDEGPLYFWSAALFSDIFRFLEPHFAVRIFSALLTAVSLVAIWYATYALAKRPEAQPSDPFRLAAHPVDFARCVADISVLVLISCFGIIERTHETTTEVLQLSLIAVFLWSCAYALDSPRRGGLLAGMAIGATVMAKGPVAATGLLLTALCLPLLLREYRLVAKSMLVPLLLASLLLGMLWPLGLYFGDSGSRSHLLLWLTAAVPIWNTPSLFVDNIIWTAKNTPWYLWPLWPIAIWTLIRWRGAWAQPVIALPFLTATLIAILLLISGQSNASQLMTVIPPLAVLAALGLPTLSKGLTNLLDWLALMIFSTFALLIWAYYLALLTGTPPKMAKNATRFAAGLETDVNWMWLTLAIGATVIWIAVVVWRISSVHKPIWRTMTLSSAGLTLVWFLLMSLWLPVFNHRKTYRDVSLQIAEILPKKSCLSSAGLRPAERAILGYYLRVPFAEQVKLKGRLPPATGPCEWLLIVDRTDKPVLDPQVSQWTLRWQGRRVAAKNERVRLYGLRTQTPMLAKETTDTTAK